jgi:alpha-beta hydrolase superfamily lysophospholipase
MKTKPVETVETDLAGSIKVSVPVNTYRKKEMFFGRIIFTGLDWGDIVASLREIDLDDPAGEWAVWHANWKARGEYYEQRALQARRDGRMTTFRQWTQRAAACHHFSELFYFENPPAKEAARKRVTELFLSIIDLLPERVEKLSIPYGDLQLPAYYMHPTVKCNGPSPCVILINGADSAKEVELYTFARSFAERGLGVMLFDGPGQGELLGHTAQVIEFESVFRLVLDRVKSMNHVDIDRIGVFGVSFGGYLSARVASAFQDELRACINLSGGFDHDALPMAPPLLQHDFRYLFQLDSREAMDKIAVEKLNLRGHAPLKIPLLCIHATEDRIIPYDSCERMMEWAQGPKELITYNDHGHVCINHFHDLIPRFADWMAGHLQGNP